MYPSNVQKFKLKFFNFAYLELRFTHGDFWHKNRNFYGKSAQVCGRDPVAKDRDSRPILSIRLTQDFSEFGQNRRV